MIINLWARACFYWTSEQKETGWIGCGDVCSLGLEVLITCTRKFLFSFPITYPADSYTQPYARMRWKERRKKECYWKVMGNVVTDRNVFEWIKRKIQLLCNWEILSKQSYFIFVHLVFRYMWRRLRCSDWNISINIHIRIRNKSSSGWFYCHKIVKKKPACLFMSFCLAAAQRYTTLSGCGGLFRLIVRWICFLRGFLMNKVGSNSGTHVSIYSDEL